MSSAQIKKILSLVSLLLITFAAGQAAQAQTQRPAGAAPINVRPGVVKFQPGLKVESLAGRPDTDVIEFKGGRQMTLRELRKWDAFAKAIQAPKVDRTPLALKLKPAPTGAPVRSAADLDVALKTRRDSETLQLPSGKTMTVAMARMLQPFLERRLGHPLGAVAAPVSYSGPRVQVTAKTTSAEWQTVVQRPDNTVIVTPGGKMMTVGQLKQYIKAKAPDKAAALERISAQGLRPVAPRTNPPAPQKGKK